MTEEDLDEVARFRYETIKAIPEEKGAQRDLAIRRAAAKLARSEKTIGRYLEDYKDMGISAFVHGNTGRSPSTAFSVSVRDTVVYLYRQKFRDANFTHFSEILEEDYHIKVSDQTLHRWLKPLKIVSPKSRKRTVRKMNQKIQEEAKAKEEEKRKKDEALSRQEMDELAKAAIILDEKDAHPTRPRSKYFGEMCQMDASQYKWNGRNIWHLHLAVDDATSHVVGAWFDHQETLNGYYHVLEMILRRYGIPFRFYTDKRTVFEYSRKDKDERIEENDTFTQFAYACQVLGIEIRTTSVAASKGRVERGNGSFQGRLPVDLRRKGIKDIDEANRFLRDEYIDAYNRHFAPLTEKDIRTSVFAPSPSDEVINSTLAVITERTINNGNCIRFSRKSYMPVKENGSRVLFKPRTKGFVIRAYDGTLLLNVDDVLYGLEEVEERRKTSREFDDDAKEEKPKRRHIPPLDHPWRQKALRNRQHFSFDEKDKGGKQ